MSFYEEFKSAIDAALKQSRNWREQGLLAQDEYHVLVNHFEDLSHKVQPEDDLTKYLGPATQEEKTSAHRDFYKIIRFIDFIDSQLRVLYEQGILSDIYSLLKNELDKRRIKCQIKLKGKTESYVERSFYDDLEIVEPKVQAKVKKPVQPKTSLIERLLDPRSLQTMMSIGGGLLVLGIVIWLYTIGIFENAKIVAYSLGAGNALIVLSGVYLASLTKYKIAGRGLAMLGSLLLPLNLWFYDAQGLVTLDNGGHLWVPAFVICVMYAGIALLLTDSLFVYAFVGGVSLTGLLILGDQKLARFYEILAPSSLLVILGLICLHVERLFADVGKINRFNFGNAFFKAGHVTLLTGLAILLGGRIFGHFYNIINGPWFQIPIPDVCTNQEVQLAALGLTLSATWGYLYSWMTRKSKLYSFAAIMTMIWSGIILFDLLNIEVTETLFIFVLAFVALVVRGFEIFPMSRTGNEENTANKKIKYKGVEKFWMNPSISYADILVTLPVFLGLFSYVRMLVNSIPEAYSYETNWLLVVSMGVVSVVAGLGIFMHRQEDQREKVLYMTHVAGLSFVLGLYSMLMLLGFSFALNIWVMIAVILLCAGISVFKSNVKNYLPDALIEISAFFVTLTLMLYSSGLMRTGIASDVEPINLGIMGGFLTVVFGYLAMKSKSGFHSFITGFTGWYAVVNFLMHFNFVTYSQIFAGSLLGLIILVVEMVLQIRKSVEVAGNIDVETDMKEKRTLNNIGLTFVNLASVAGLLLTLNRVLGGGLNWDIFNLVLGQTLVTMLSSLAVRGELSRRSLFSLTVLHFMSGILVINNLTDISLFRNFEIFGTALGVVMLIVGHAGWKNEDENEEDSMVSFNLTTGSILATLPMMIGLFVQRVTIAGAYSWGWSLSHDIGLITMGLILFGLGNLCRIKSTTIMGAASLALYVFSLVFLIRLPEVLQNIAVYMMIGGGTFFILAIVLSVYREHLMTLPSRIKNGEGIYKVFNWR